MDTVVKIKNYMDITFLSFSGYLILQLNGTFQTDDSIQKDRAGLLRIIVNCFKHNWIIIRQSFFFSRFFLAFLGDFFIISRMKVKFWGVRGSIGSPVSGAVIRKKIEKVLSLATPADIQNEDTINRFLSSLSFSTVGTYGGNTTCIEVRDSGDNLIIIDAGTGIRELGNSLLSTKFLQGKGKAYWLFTHSHWDHIQGIPFFVPLYIPGNEFEIFSSMQDIESRIRLQHVSTHFPVPYEGLGSTRRFHFIPEGTQTQITPVLTALSKSVRHPGGSYSYKLKEGDKTFIFTSDAEFNIDEMENIESYIEYFSGADLLVFDTQYTFEESLNKIDWGHSSASIATDIALKAGVKKLVMFHHDPSYNDEKLDAVFLRALNYKAMMDRKNELEIIMAYEGLEIEL